MRQSTQRGAGVDAMTRASLDEALKEQLLQPRRVYLKGRAPRDRYIVQMRKDIERGQRRPIPVLMASMFADVEDGIPASLVTAVLDSMKASVEEHAAKSQRVTPLLSLLPLVNREARVEADLREAENRALAEQTPDALVALEREESLVIAAAQRTTDVVRRLLVRTRMQRA